MSRQEVPAILVTGDVMLDRRVEGEMARISPEAPAPVVRQRSLSVSAGGAGNVAANVASLGCQSLLVGVTGTDGEGELLAQALQGAGISHSLITRPGRTTVKTRITCGGQQVMRVDDENDSPLSPDPGDIARRLETFLTGQLQVPLRAIIVSDYDKGMMTPATMDAVRALAAARGLPVFVDAKPQRLSVYAGAAVVKPNLLEARRWMDIVHCVHPGVTCAGTSTDLAAVAVGELRSRLHIWLPIVTCGAAGVAYFDPSPGVERVEHQTATAHHVYDPTGAGDTFLAAVAVALVQGLPPALAVRFANCAAGLAVQVHGVTAVQREAVDEAIRQQAGWSAKLLTPQDAAALATSARARGRTVALAPGCFDGLHAGHIELLREAKRYGDVVLVAYNDDESLRALKGPGRPTVPDSFRASHLAQLASVDGVFRYDGDVEALVRIIQPDVLVKGEDARAAGIVPGADYVADRKGLVLFVPRSFGVSSTALASGNSIARRR